MARLLSTEPPASPGACTEPEITEPVDLCRADGTLNPAAIGWSRRPLHRANLRGWGRAKRWDYWCVTAYPWVLSVTVAHVDYLSLVSVWIRDFSTGRYVERNLGMPLGVGLHVPDTVGGADIVVEQGDSRVALLEEAGGTRLLVDTSVKDGSGRSDVKVDVLAALPDGHETLGVVIPWSERLFQYTSKHNTRPATGLLSVGSDDVVLGAGGLEAWGCLDYGRGRWPYRTVWNWGSASGHSDGRVLGLQLGGRWTAGTGMTENALCLDGRLHKLSEELVWEYSLAAPTSAWAVTTPRSSRVDLEFRPEWNRSARLELGVASNRAQVCFGRWSGSVVDDAGAVVGVDDLFGWAEDLRWRW